MVYEIIPTPKFDEDVKFYFKKRRFRHIDDDLDVVIDKLIDGDLVGDAITDVNANNKTYKVRAANSDMNVGQANGYRLIYYAVTEDLKIYLLTVYCKKDDDRVLTKIEIKEIIEEYCL